MPAPLAVSIALPFVQPSVDSRNSSPPLSTVTLPQLRMLFQSTHEDRHGAEAPAELGERMIKITATAHPYGAHHESLGQERDYTRTHQSVSGRLKCWRCSARSVFLRGPLTLILLFSQSFFLPLSLNPHSRKCLRRRLNRCTSIGTLLVFCRNFLSKSL